MPIFTSKLHAFPAFYFQSWLNVQTRILLLLKVLKAPIKIYRWALFLHFKYNSEIVSNPIWVGIIHRKIGLNCSFYKFHSLESNVEYRRGSIHKKHKPQHFTNFIYTTNARSFIPVQLWNIQVYGGQSKTIAKDNILLVKGHSLFFMALATHYANLHIVLAWIPENRTRTYPEKMLQTQPKKYVNLVVKSRKVANFRLVIRRLKWKSNRCLLLRNEYQLFLLLPCHSIHTCPIVSYNFKYYIQHTDIEVSCHPLCRILSTFYYIILRMWKYRILRKMFLVWFWYGSGPVSLRYSVQFICLNVNVTDGIVLLHYGWTMPDIFNLRNFLIVKHMFASIIKVYVLETPQHGSQDYDIIFIYAQQIEDAYFGIFSNLIESNWII